MRVRSPSIPTAPATTGTGGAHDEAEKPQHQDGDGVDHARTSATFLTGAHPSRNKAGKAVAGPSIDQLYARIAGQQTVIPSLQLAIESKDVASGPNDAAWPAGYSAAYRQSLSWADDVTPLPAEQRLDVIFARLFGAPPTAGKTTSASGSKRAPMAPGPLPSPASPP